MGTLVGGLAWVRVGSRRDKDMAARIAAVLALYGRAGTAGQTGEVRQSGANYHAHAAPLAKGYNSPPKVQS